MWLFIRDMENSHTTVTRLREVLLQARSAVTPEKMEVLVQSMARRLRDVMAARWGHAWYQLENRKTRSATVFPEMGFGDIKPFKMYFNGNILKSTGRVK